jgi:hypothetical protein
LLLLLLSLQHWRVQTLLLLLLLLCSPAASIWQPRAKQAVLRLLYANSNNSISRSSSGSNSYTAGTAHSI